MVSESTVLFLDDRFIAKLTNLVPTLGEPELLSVFRDPNASNYVGWGYPSVIRATPQDPCRMLYQGYSNPKLILMAESDDCIHWRPSELNRTDDGPNVLFASSAEQAFVFDDAAHAATPAERFNLLLSNGSRVCSADGLSWRLAGRWQAKGIDPGFSVFRRDSELVVESRPPILRQVTKTNAAQCAAVGGCGRHVGLNGGSSWEALGAKEPQRCLPVDKAYKNSDQIYGMPTYSYDDLYVSFLWRFHCRPKKGENGNAEGCFSGGNNSAELAFSYSGYNFSRFSPSDQPDAPATLFKNGPQGSPTFGQVYPNSLLRTGDGKMLVHASASTHQHGYCTGTCNKTSLPGEQWSSLLTYSLREDGFVGLRLASAAAGPGIVTTRPLRWAGGELFLNFAAVGSGSGIRVQILTEAGSVIPGYGDADAVPGHGDELRFSPRWKGGKSMAALAGRVLVIEVEMVGAETELFAMRGAMTLA